MKLKGVNPIEHHIEKIVLGLMLILLLAGLSMQFITRPNDIDVGSRKVAPDQVYTVLEGQADQLQSQLTDQNPALPKLKPVDLVERYNHAFELGSGGEPRLSSALGTGVDITTTIGTHIEAVVANDGPIGALHVPATTTPIGVSMWSTLDPYAVVQVPEYAEFVPDHQPYDFPSVSIEATFNGKDLEAALLGKNGSDGAIPRRFWSATGLAVLGFEAQRQRLMPDGTWGGAEEIVTPPHTPIPMRALNEDAGLLDLTSLVSKAKGVIDEIARPMFPPTIAGAEWTPPSDLVGSDDDSESTTIHRLQRRLERSRTELERLSNPPPGGRSPGAQSPRSNGGRGRGGGGRGTQPPSVLPGGSKRKPQERIDRLKNDIKKLEEQLKELGVKVDDARARNTRTSKSDVRSVLEEDAAELWAHDLGVEPGATYRYHTRVVVNNPLFRKGSELDPDDADQQALTKDPFARGAWSAWSEPVVVGARAYFFVTAAENDQRLDTGEPKATIELYKVFYGHYRRSTLSVSPGDGLASSVRMSGDLLVFDPALIDANEAAKAIANLDKKDASTSLPEGISELASRITIDLGVYLLDIYTDQSGQAGGQAGGLGGTEVPMKVVLRDADGGVIVRSDIQDKGSPAYKLASSSSSSASDTPIRAPGAPAISPASALFEPKSP